VASKTGYILLHRSLLDHWLWPSGRAYTETEAWVWLLAMAAHTPYKQLSDGKLVFVNVGELLISISDLARTWGWGRKRTAAFLELLQKEDMISAANGTRYDSRLKVTNYKAFQAKSKPSGTANDSDDDSDSVTANDSPQEQMAPLEASQKAAKEPLLNKDKELKEIHSSSRKNFSEEDYQIAEWIFSLLLEMNPKHRRPNMESWADTIRLMREQDHRTDEEIRAVFSWAHNDTFWKENILSPAALRRQFDSLTIKKNNSRPKHHMNSADSGQRIIV
jgi:hypothetical protein